MAHIEFPVTFLYTERGTVEEFSAAVTQRIRSAIDHEEMEFHSRGIEVLKHPELGFRGAGALSE